ncbi:helix-turn-helix transcriptional regulator [Altererythrobacter sp.]|uniref:helix-turn-helix transcriptional regulator n=1 Tax=Altererythrobacter sp. TaxID=1872480 RepID=UPI003D04CBB7
MGSMTARQLTERQLAVMERIDRRVPIKVIARELGVSETRINQHIRTLKDIYGAESLNELVEIYRRDVANGEGVPSQDKEQAPLPSGQDADGPAIPLGQDEGSTEEEIVEPRVVPAALDGPNATLARLALIAVLAAAMLGGLIAVAVEALEVVDTLVR